MPTAKPTQPPQADMSALVKAVDTLMKAAGKSFTSTLPAWKRWVGGETEFDGKGLRDVVNANALYLDQVKASLDSVTATTDGRLDRLETKVAALESQPSAPFPESGLTRSS